LLCDSVRNTKNRRCRVGFLAVCEPPSHSSSSTHPRFCLILVGISCFKAPPPLVALRPIVNAALSHVDAFAPQLRPRQLLLEILPLLHSPVTLEDSLSDSTRTHRPATLASLGAGLGARGKVIIPKAIWDELKLPPTLPHLSTHNTRLCTFDSLVMLHTICRDGFLFPIDPQPGIPIFTLYNFTLYIYCPGPSHCRCPPF